ncbi:hypothetical protein [Thermoleptolyngbya sp. PKUAC-SCTB121]|uniref:hypothetical protein n=1 Tax=Thermoleptolyngbya sp. PKUAC-SCTB121 TaxID=2811482 RepID=UPI001965A43E|nr:hypothetical protein [Thermoleptolyngbya sp. PKUAC-SCTB121]
MPSLTNLRITEDELERLTGLDISDTFMGRAIRPSVLRSRRRLRSLLMSEVLTLGLSIIFCLPVSLVIARNLPGFTGEDLDKFLAISLGIAVGLFALWNGYLWRQGKQLSQLSHLLDQVDRHNEIIDAIALMEELDSVRANHHEPVDRQEIFQALDATRSSLICALTTERIVRKHQKMIAKRAELAEAIAQNLAMLQTLQENATANEYGQFLTEALSIGIIVQQELSEFMPSESLSNRWSNE